MLPTSTCTSNSDRTGTNSTYHLNLIDRVSGVTEPVQSDSSPPSVNHRASVQKPGTDVIYPAHNLQGKYTPATSTGKAVLSVNGILSPSMRTGSRTQSSPHPGSYPSRKLAVKSNSFPAPRARPGKPSTHRPRARPCAAACARSSTTGDVSAWGMGAPSRVPLSIKGGVVHLPAHRAQRKRFSRDIYALLVLRDRWQCDGQALTQ